jgi:hypothetical protein
MLVTFAMILRNCDDPMPTVRSAALMRLMADRLDSEEKTGSVSSVGRGVQIGQERLTVTAIERDVVPMNEDK